MKKGLRTEQIVAKALKKVNDDRYILALMVAKRAEALANGETKLIENCENMKFSDIALLEIAEGKIALNGIKEAD